MNFDFNYPISSFKWFLDYPEKYPSESTFWKFKEDINDSKSINSIWE